MKIRSGREDLQLNVGPKQQYGMLYVTITKIWLCQRWEKKKACGKSILELFV